MNNYYGGNWADGAHPSQTLSKAVVNSFLQRVFVIMSAGLAITGLAAWLFFKLIFVTDAAGAIEGVSSSYGWLVTSPMRWVIMLAPLAFVLILSFGINKLSYAAATLLFAAYAFVTGISLSFIFALYTTGSVALTFFVTAGAFAALAIYGITTKADLSKLGAVAMMGLFGIIIAMLINFFVHSSTFDLVISIIGVLIFTALTAYDTQRIMRMSLSTNADTEEAKKSSILGALTLYLDFINMFLFLLRLMGNRR